MQALDAHLVDDTQAHYDNIFILAIFIKDEINEISFHYESITFRTSPRFPETLSSLSLRRSLGPRSSSSPLIRAEDICRDRDADVAR